MSPELPEIDVDQIAEIDRRQAYYLLYQFMKDDFLTKKDFSLHVSTMTALPNQGFKVDDKMIGAYPIGEITSIVYQLLYETGAGAREGLISAAEEVIE